MKNLDYILYFDLDGVLVDYSGGWWAAVDRLKIKPTEANGEFNKEDLMRVGKPYGRWETLCLKTCIS